MFPPMLSSKPTLAVPEDSRRDSSPETTSSVSSSELSPKGSIGDALYLYSRVSEGKPPYRSEGELKVVRKKLAQLLKDNPIPPGVISAHAGEYIKPKDAQAFADANMIIKLADPEVVPTEKEKAAKIAQKLDEKYRIFINFDSLVTSQLRRTDSTESLVKGQQKDLARAQQEVDKLTTPEGRKEINGLVRELKAYSGAQFSGGEIKELERRKTGEEPEKIPRTLVPIKTDTLAEAEASQPLADFKGERSFRAFGKNLTQFKFSTREQARGK